MLTTKVWPISEEPAEKTATFWTMRDTNGSELSQSTPQCALLAPTKKKCTEDND